MRAHACLAMADIEQMGGFQASSSSCSRASTSMLLLSVIVIHQFPHDRGESKCVYWCRVMTKAAASRNTPLMAEKETTESRP